MRTADRELLRDYAVKQRRIFLRPRLMDKVRMRWHRIVAWWNWGPL